MKEERQMKYLLKSEDCLKALKEKRITPEDGARFLKTEVSRDEINYFLKNQNDKKSDFDFERDVPVLKNIIGIALYIYTFSGTDTGLSDSEYDILYSLYVRLTGDDSFTINDNGKEEKDRHAYPILRGTLDKIYSLGEKDEYQRVNEHRESLDKWIQRREDEIYTKTGRHVDLNKEEVFVFPKWDGCSCVFEFNENGKLEKALTRGYTKMNTAKNITCHFKGLEDEWDGCAHGLKTEIMVKNSDIELYESRTGKHYAQSRSVASSIINQDNECGSEDLLVIKRLRMIKKGGEIETLSPYAFDDPFIKCRLGDRDAILNFALTHRVVNDLRCDGVVIHLINKDLIKILGRENDKNRYEVAYKFTEEYTYSEIVDIDFQMGLFGRLAPVARIKPVKLKGNTISSVSLGSMAIYRKMNFSKGDKIKILYDIIPCFAIDENCKISMKNPIGEPRYCPSCGHLLEKDGDIVACRNPKCDWVIKGRILNYLNKMKIDNISFATVSLLYDKKFIKDIDDLYKLKDHKKELAKLDGFGKQKVERFLSTIESSRTGFTDWMLLGAIGIEGSSQKTFKSIMNLYTIDDLMDMVDHEDYDLLTLVPGIGEKKAKKILKSLKHSKELLHNLLKYVEVEHETSHRNLFKVCFTKIRDKELEDFIEEKGGEVTDNVTNSTDFVIVPNLYVSSSKIEKAKKNNIPIIEIDKAKEYINSNWKF